MVFIYASSNVGTSDPQAFSFFSSADLSVSSDSMSTAKSPYSTLSLTFSTWVLKIAGATREDWLA